MEPMGSRDAFTRMGTLGIEEEFFVVDPDTGRPVAGTDELVYETEPPEPLSGRIDHELFTFVLEAQTPRIESVEGARDTLLDVRQALADHAADNGFGVAAAGLHPYAKWRELEHAKKERYRAQLDRIQYPQHRNTTAGLHVHVGVDDADKAVWVANELREHMPALLALSANSPFWNGFDTGLASARAKIFEGLPNTGMPTAFESYEEFDRFERRMVESGSIDDRGELWFEVRPHSAHGTVEVRTPDAQADPARVLAFVEYVHALVVDLAERFEDGESASDPRREILEENKWRALRYGREASFLEASGAETVSLETVVERECDRLGVEGLEWLLEAEGGATRQRRLWEREDATALCDALRIEQFQD